MKCPICSNEFKPKVYWQRICDSAECRRANKLKNHKEWAQKNKEHVIKYQREYRNLFL